MTNKPQSKIVAYLRTSTKDQLLGIEGQRATIVRIAQERTCQVVKTFTEHESGGDSERPELAKGIAYARSTGSLFVVAKLDRLARDSTFLMGLYDGGVPIVFGDLPEVDGSAASRLIVQMMANIAEFERRRIGERTKAALAVLKAQGKKLGSPQNLKPEHRATGVKKACKLRIERAIAETAHVAPEIARMRAGGMTLQAIANELNRAEYVARQGGEWSATQVMRILDRSKAG